ncbi:hypothetical protein PAHAL_3G467200 [Panicum hallii]|jgi:hypothetical protein|uniref:Uncharacterized protein n=1 Tax=Panicum hallii TaxID=206008 RepID=A0A2T8KLP9_9POAL|nr:hypothetical protein PAHAL_3G467200 [Panicum hallii]
MDEKDLNLILMQGKFLLTFQKNLINGFDSFLGFDVFKQCILTNLVTQCNFVELRMVHSEYAWTINGSRCSNGT